MPQLPLIPDSILHPNVYTGGSWYRADSLGNVSIAPAVKEEVPFDLSGYQGVVAEVRPQNLEPKPKVDFTPDWTLIVFLFGLIAIAWMRVVFPRQFQTLFTAFVAPRFLRQAMREEVPLTHPGALSLLILFALTGGMLGYQMQTHGFHNFYLFEGEGVLLFFKFTGLVAAIYFVKVTVIGILQLVIRSEGVLPEYLFSVMLFNKVLAILLLPITIAIAYMNPNLIDGLIWTGLILFALLWIYRIGRGIFSGITWRVSFMYLFLYLCTLEILPLIVLFGMFKGENSMFS